MELALRENDFIVSKTDLSGRITYGNETFIMISGYQEKELLHAPHNILRHPEMPCIVFELLWARLKSRQSINAYVKNRCKNGDFYWVFANVTPSYDAQGNVIGYYSVRRKPKESAIRIVEPLYAELVRAEKQGGAVSSGKRLEAILTEQGVTYDEFIINLQK